MTEEQRLMIGDCEDRGHKLTDWELGFIDSVSRLDWLTDRQAETLEKLWERVT